MTSASRSEGRTDSGYLALRSEVLGVEAGGGVERPVQESDVGPPVAQQPFLLAGPAGQDVDRDGVGLGGVRVEQLGQQLDRRGGLGDQDDAG